MKNTRERCSWVNGINQFDIHANWFLFCKKSADVPLVIKALFSKFMILYYCLLTQLLLTIISALSYNPLP